MKNIKIGLAGNPNVGKSTLFNQLTGMHQHVGNWPGKTVEKTEGTRKHKNQTIEIIDLPGNYSLTAHSIEEIISRDYIVDEESDVIVNIVNAENLERNLYLTVQMMELGANLVLALNMNKFAKKQGYQIDAKKLSQTLGIPVVEIEATEKNQDKLLDEIIKAAKNPINPTKNLSYNDELNDHIPELKQTIEKYNILPNIPSSWTAIKLLENDKIIHEKIKQTEHSNEILTQVKDLQKHLKEELKLDVDEALANSRYEYIDATTEQSVKKVKPQKKSKTEIIDKITTNKFLGIPIFILIMWLIFQITFTVGDPFMGWIEEGFGMLGGAIGNLLGDSWISSLIVDGIIGGVGGVIVFLPNIILMFLCLSFLEDCGYLARAAFVMDRIMHKITGLHGKAIIPMILGFGCCVPGVMATRTMDNEEDRLTTMFILPFMSCSARLPVYILFIGAFFTAYQGEVLLSLYLLGIIVAIIMAFVFKKFLFKGEKAPFIMELPPYRLPTIKSVIMHTWDKSKAFLKKAGTIIFLLSIIIWVLSTLPMGVDYGSQGSVIGQIGTTIAPVFEPLGFGSWEAASAIIFGVLAKEVVVSTFGTIFGVAEEGAGILTAVHHLFTPLSAFSFMVFILLYLPCLATIATIKRETNSWKWAAFVSIMTIVVAYIVSFIVYQGGLLLGFT